MSTKFLGEYMNLQNKKKLQSQMRHFVNAFSVVSVKLFCCPLAYSEHSLVPHLDHEYRLR